MAAGIGGPWGDHAPRRPQAGAGRIALVRRVNARGGNERRGALEAARRGMQRGPRGRLLKRVAEVELPEPVKHAWTEVVRQSRLVQQKLLQRQKLKSIGIGLLVIWLAWTFVLGDAGFPRLLWVRMQNEKLEREIQQLEIENASLQAQVDQLEKGGNEIVDKLAREEQAMVKDGEVLVRFYDPKGKKVPDGAVQALATGPPGKKKDAKAPPAAADAAKGDAAKSDAGKADAAKGSPR